MAPIGCKFFIERNYANSHCANPYQSYQSHHANSNQTRKLSLNIMIYTPEHVSVKNDEPIFDNDYNNLATPGSPEITIRSKQVADELRSTP